MKGYPKNLNTKEDYEYVRSHFDKELWEQDWQNLLDTEYDWVETGIVTENAPAVMDATHKVIEESGDEGDGEEVVVQYELQLIPTCKLLRLGFTEEYVKDVLDGKDVDAIYNSAEDIEPEEG